MVFLNEILLNNTGQSAAILLDDAASKTSKNIYLNLNPAMKGDESYALVVDFDAIKIEGKTAKGVFMAFKRCANSSLSLLLPMNLSMLPIPFPQFK